MLKNSKKYLLSTLCLLIYFLLAPLAQGFCETASNEKVYRLGYEDVVTISITAGGEEQVKTNMVVADNGYVNVPFIGKINAAGLTLNELEKLMLIPLETDFFVDPQILLQIAEYHSLQFFISGAVKNPGMFELDFTPTIMDLVANAGGVLPERGNIAYILRGDNSKDLDVRHLEEDITKKEPIKVDLLKLLDEGDMSENIKLQSGDTIYIPLGTKLNQSTTKVYVQGEVKKPGVFDYQPGITALAACIMAGGFDKFAAPNRAKVIRQTESGQESIDINLEKIQTGDQPDLSLKPGDRIHIPESWL